MLIDWFTVGAQIVNFLVLVWLLKRYLYRPMLTAIDAREKDIVSRRDAALAAQKEAQHDRDESRRAQRTLDQQRLALLDAAREEAKAEGARLIEEATRDAEKLRLARHKELEEETLQFRDELIRLTRQEIIALVRKILADLASADLERSAVDVFLRRLDQLPALQNGDASVQLADGAAPLRLRSAFALSPAQQETVSQAVRQKFQDNARLEFETAPDLGLGLELIAHDQKIAWNIDSYLAAFGARLAEFAHQPSSSPSV